MKFRAECPNCQTRYLLPLETFPEKGGKVACRKCGTRWMVNAPAPASPTGSTTANVPGPSPAPVPPAVQGRAPRASAPNPLVCCPHCAFHYLRSAAQPLHESDARQRILLVEDQDYFRNLIREALGDRYLYIVAPNVDQALRILHAQNVDMVILDLNLEGVNDGLEVLQGWQAQGVPVLILTGNEEPDLYGEKWEEMRRLGATDLLIKGLNIREQLAMKITGLLQGGDPSFFQPAL